MKVWVIMCNDYPHSVADNEGDADAFVNARKTEGKVEREKLSLS